MPRRYDSSRRRKAAANTRRDILDAALKLHWEGVAELEPLAAEAGCSLATVRKHFPTKEDLYRNCTSTFAETLTMPDVDALSGISDPADRRRQSVGELCRIHEAMMGYAWFGAHERARSDVLDEVMRGYEGLADAIAAILTTQTSVRRPVVRGLLDFLTYRALRISGNLTPDQANDELVNAIEAALGERPAARTHSSPTRART